MSAALQTRPIELCNIDRCQRFDARQAPLGSSDLSHLFSQGFVSPRLLQEDKSSRKAADEKLRHLTKDPSFRFFETATLRTEDFEIMYVIVATSKGRSPVQALPFFSKVNLERTVQQLTNKGYQVSLSPVDTGQVDGNSVGPPELHRAGWAIGQSPDVCQFDRRGEQ